MGFEPTRLASGCFQDNCLQPLGHRSAETRYGRGAGIRTLKTGFGDRRFTVEPTPLHLHATYLTIECYSMQLRYQTGMYGLLTTDLTVWRSARIIAPCDAEVAELADAHV